MESDLTQRFRDAVTLHDRILSQTGRAPFADEKLHASDIARLKSLSRLEFTKAYRDDSARIIAGFRDYLANEPEFRENSRRWGSYSTMRQYLILSRYHDKLTDIQAEAGVRIEPAPLQWVNDAKAPSAQIIMDPEDLFAEGDLMLINRDPGHQNRTSLSEALRALTREQFTARQKCLARGALANDIPDAHPLIRDALQLAALHLIGANISPRIRSAHYAQATLMEARLAGDQIGYFVGRYEIVQRPSNLQPGDPSA